MKSFFFHRDRGFTLIEILLSIAILSLLMSFLISAEDKVLSRNRLFEATATVTTAVRTASLKSKIADQDSAWGAMLAAEHITVYKGATYATRDTNMDDVVDLPAGITISATGGNDIAFKKLSGSPTKDSTITIANESGDNVFYLNLHGILEPRLK